MSKPYTFDAWATDADGWDTDTGAPGIILFGNAIQTWAVMQNRSVVTVADAAAAFNVEPRRVAEAVHAHRWMALGLPSGSWLEKEDDATGADVPLPAGLDYARMTIEHDGE